MPSTLIPYRMLVRLHLRLVTWVFIPDVAQEMSAPIGRQRPWLAVLGSTHPGRDCGYRDTFMRCKACLVGAHMKCVGFKRERHWRKTVWECDMCLYKLPKAAANCACCPAPGGILRQVCMIVIGIWIGQSWP